MKYHQPQRCRGHHEWEDDMDYLVLDVMDFDYDFDGAPLSCP
ncbi:hypothetical protein OV203_43310 [Nannocystis sp. ILAH1]|nr:MULTISPECIES: hypothetical protein [unclassified Nannocystis]MCY0994047.1 hypothetical protein [Nannocystis sp. ILAH1]MCY1067015.1 hypothetical protein [Nannocystis sp. RBIL2]